MYHGICPNGAPWLEMMLGTYALEMGPRNCTKTTFHTMSPHCETSIFATFRNQSQKSIEFLASIAAVQRKLYGQAGAQAMGPKMGPRIWRPGL